MFDGTAKQRKDYPVCTIAQQPPQEGTSNILGFLALTWSDTTSSFTGFGKKKRSKVFKQYPNLVYGFHQDGSMPDVEEFVCQMYLFEKGNKALEKMPWICTLVDATTKQGSASRQMEATKQLVY